MNEKRLTSQFRGLNAECVYLSLSHSIFLSSCLFRYYLLQLFCSIEMISLVDAVLVEIFGRTLPTFWITISHMLT